MADESTHVKLKHKNGNVWECPVDAVDHWKSLGWSKAAADAEPTNDVAAVAAPNRES